MQPCFPPPRHFLARRKLKRAYALLSYGAAHRRNTRSAMGRYRFRIRQLSAMVGKLSGMAKAEEVISGHRGRPKQDPQPLSDPQ